MHPREFLKHYQYDNRLITGDYYESQPVQAEPGDTIAVVLLNMGGPDKLSDIEPFLYNLFMDPAIIDIPLRGVFRHWISSWISSKRSAKVAHDYLKIGGGSPINRLTREQASSLELALNRRFGRAAGVTFRVYMAMRYWHPTSEEAAQQMKQDGVTKVVLLPLYPQYSKTTSGASFIYWWMLEQKNEIPQWPTTCVKEYAAHPKYIQAISERMDEALEQFPAEVRHKVQFLFSAHGTPLHEMKKRRDPYCCLIHSTVEQVMKFRQHDRPFHVAFQSKVGPAQWLTPSTPDKLRELADLGHNTVLVIPVAFVTDHIETAFELDMLIRDEAEAFGIKHYVVSGGLNAHPLFIDALAEAAMSQIALPAQADESAAFLPYNELPKYGEDDRTCRCHQCESITEAARWQPEGVAAK